MELPSKLCFAGILVKPLACAVNYFEGVGACLGKCAELFANIKIHIFHVVLFSCFNVRHIISFKGSQLVSVLRWVMLSVSFSDENCAAEGWISGIITEFY